MVWDRPPAAEPPPSWSLHGPGLGRRGWMIAAAVGATLVASAGGLLWWTGPDRGSSSNPSPVATRYQVIADASLHKCNPEGEASAYVRCLGVFSEGVRKISFPSSAQQDVDTLSLGLKLAQSCVAKPNHDNPGLREWDIGCPQGGTADPQTAAIKDAAALSEFHRQFLISDMSIHGDLGG